MRSDGSAAAAYVEVEPSPQCHGPTGTSKPASGSPGQQKFKERFGVTPQGPLFEAVSKAAKEPVDPDVSAMLVGLHGERRGKVLRLRTEAWAPALSASAVGKTVELKPGVVAELPDCEEIELVLRGAKVRVKTSF